jgi:hypothetical protein
MTRIIHPIAAPTSPGSGPADRPGPKVCRLHSVRPIAPAALRRIMDSRVDLYDSLEESWEKPSSYSLAVIVGLALVPWIALIAIGTVA